MLCILYTPSVIKIKGYSMRLLENKVVIITGASSGIGYETAKLFAKEGAKLVLTSRREKELTNLVEEIQSDGGQAIALVGNVKEEALAKALVDLAIHTYGRLDVAFNNAGTLGALGTITDMSLDEWNETIATNLTSAFLGAKYQIEAMKQNGGSIIFTSTFVGYTVGMPNMSAYAASKAGKAGIIGLTQSLATEVAVDNIRVNALLPGGTDTPMGRSVANTEEAVSFVEGLHAMKRMATSQEIAKSALYLATDLSSFTTGTALLCDGGISINRT